MKYQLPDLRFSSVEKYDTVYGVYYALCAAIDGGYQASIEEQVWIEEFENMMGL